MKMMKLVLIGLVALSAQAKAAEISLLSGVYQNEESKLNGDDDGGKSTISLGGRFGDQLDARILWFGRGELVLRSHDAPKGGKAPSSSTSLAVGGGLRYYFDPFSQSVAPYIEGEGSFQSIKDGKGGSAQVTETETNGLFYAAAAGVRVGLDSTFFFDFQAELFESALFATVKSETTTIATNQTTKSETSRTELFGKTFGNFSDIVIGVGMML
jgi:hypothetical protein